MSARPNQPFPNIRIFHDDLVPGDESRPSALPPRALSAIALLAAPVRADDKVLAKVNGAEIQQSDLTMAEEELAPSLAQMDPATKDENVLSFLIDMKIVAKAAEDKKIADTDGIQEAPRLHPQPAADGQPARRRRQGRDHRRGHEEGL